MDCIVAINRSSETAVKKVVKQLAREMRREATLTVFCSSRRVRKDYVNRYFWKAIGLILCDGNFSSLVRGYRTITFRGITEGTLIAVMRTFLPLQAYLRVRTYRYGGSRYFNVSVLSRGAFSRLRTSMLETLHRLALGLFDLRGISDGELSALIAGLIDGDGYIGKKGGYISVSLALDKNAKGGVIYTILTVAEERGHIVLGHYRSKPSYEVPFKFANADFIKECLELVFHPIRRSRLRRYLLNWSKNYECGFSVKELERLLMAAYSAYVDLRGGSRKSKVLVLYLRRQVFSNLIDIWSAQSGKPKPVISGNRVMVKIAEKCSKLLKSALKESIKTSGINPQASKVLEKVVKFIKLCNETYK